MKEYFVNGIDEALKLDLTIDHKKYSVLIASRKYASDKDYYDICIYYGM